MKRSKNIKRAFAIAAVILFSGALFLRAENNITQGRHQQVQRSENFSAATSEILFDHTNMKAGKVKVIIMDTM